jgi:hypothetical protein
MINARVKVFDERSHHRLQNDVNDFLKTIDIRQVIKTDFSSSSSGDFRDIKIDNVLEIK